MSHLVSYKWIRRTQCIPQFGGFYKEVGILLGGLSDCEELVGVVNHTSECVTDLFSFVELDELLNLKS